MLPALFGQDGKMLTAFYMWFRVFLMINAVPGCRVLDLHHRIALLPVCYDAPHCGNIFPVSYPRKSRERSGPDGC
ncbi:hypothetical protein E2I00_019108 [Balaenoptera physalus]|uniref:Uncharacterized protein n=1 Tax=Balaenoptera physalus TaxID=9770 RepID=A0A643CE31_BALPH|nr:hypothetical protein E2I00_019108 [Balaenoptera physalus]